LEVLPSWSIAIPTACLAEQAALSLAIEWAEPSRSGERLLGACETAFVVPTDRTRAYTATLEPLAGNKARVPVPFDPNRAWGTKSLHHVNGTVAGIRVRVTIAVDDAGWSFTLSPARLQQGKVGPGDAVEVIIAPEGPQRSDLDPDVAAALEANPAAGSFFDSLAQFYRTGYLRWIEATKRRPDVRAQRIAEMTRLLGAGIKQRPKP
jgi:hypothetical protein